MAASAGAHELGRRRAKGRRMLIATAIAAFAGTMTGAAASAATAPAVTASVRESATAKINLSVVRLRAPRVRSSTISSGLVIRDDGYILASGEFLSSVGQGNEIEAVTTDGQHATARLVGIDQTSQLAVLQVTGLHGLLAATFADTAAVTSQQAATAITVNTTLLDTYGNVIGVYPSPTAPDAVPANDAVRVAVELIATAGRDTGTSL